MMKKIDNAEVVIICNTDGSGLEILKHREMKDLELKDSNNEVITNNTKTYLESLNNSTKIVSEEDSIDLCEIAYIMGSDGPRFDSLDKNMMYDQVYNKVLNDWKAVPNDVKESDGLMCISDYTGGVLDVLKDPNFKG